LCFAEVRKDLVVGEDNGWELRSLDVVAPGVESVHDAEELSVVNLIVPFGRSKGLGQEGTGVFDAIHVVLGEDGSSSKFGGVGFYEKCFVLVRNDQNGEVGEAFLEGFKGFVAFGCPIPGLHLL